MWYGNYYENAHLGCDGSSVEVQFCIGCAVGGVDDERLGVQVVGLFVPGGLERVVALLLLLLQQLRALCGNKKKRRLR
jgi:hypothetical protein